MTSVRRLLAATLFAGLAAGACAGPAQASVQRPARGTTAVTAATSTATPRGIVVTLLDEPAALRKDPRAMVYVIDELKPGARIVRHVLVTNDTAAPTTVEFYPSAASIAGGGFAIATGAAPNELTGWTTVSPTLAALGVGQSETETVTITVPTDAVRGEWYEGLVAAAPPQRQASGITVENRVAIRVYLAVSSARSPLPAPNFTIGSLQASRLPDGTPEVSATITNTGGRALDLSGVLRLSDGPGGVSAGPFATTGLTTLGIGASGQVTVRLDPKLPAGPWTARIDATSGLLTRAATATITFPAAGGTGPVVAAHDVGLTQRSILIPVITTLLILTALGLLLLLWKRRRRADDEEPPAGAPIDDAARLDSLLH